jgi:microsomal dipeptidase-like Zn-dependent dipeptidase
MNDEPTLRRRTLLGAAGAALAAPAPPPQPAVPAALWGIADMHFHLSSHLGFGGTLFAGEPDHPAGFTAAMPDCSGKHGIGGTGLTGANAPILTWVESTGHDPAVHLGHRTNGTPKFDGWPRFTSTIHQQAHVDWLRRAHRYGLRLIVALAVNNRMLADLYGKSRPADDRTVVHDQIEHTKAFARRHSDFLEVAYTPADARRIIRSGKLAVILGVEVDQLGNFTPRTTATDVERYLDELHAKGVRYVFPVHLTDNAFGGAALYHSDLFWALQVYLNKRPFTLVADPTVDFRYAGLLPDVLRTLTAQDGPQWHPERLHGSHTNALGLTTLGERLCAGLIRRGMMIDVDHMSQRTLERTLQLAEAARYPVNSGHTGFRPLAWSYTDQKAASNTKTASYAKTSSETLKSDDHIERIRRLGGMVAPQLLQGDIRPAYMADPAVPNRGFTDSAGSSTSFANAYLYAVSKMRRGPVAFGSDCNGFATLPGPRFGPNAAYHLSNGNTTDPARAHLRESQTAAQRNGVRYPPKWRGDRSPTISPWHHYRWAEGARANELTDEQRDMWQAIGVTRAGCDVWINSRPDGRTGIDDISERVRNLAKGIAKGLNRRPDTELERPGLFTGDAPWEQRTGWLLALNRRPADGPAEHPRVRELYRLCEPVWRETQHLDGTNTELPRATAGERDYDLNIDGFAHYGMLPDFLQDLRNIGLTEDDLRPLYASAEGFVQMWERCTRVRPN